MSNTNDTQSASENVPPLQEKVKALSERRIIEHQSQGRASAAPEGFTLRLHESDLRGFLTDDDFCGDWAGPVCEGSGWAIKTYWSPAQGVIFYVDSDRDSGIPASEAVNVAAAISKVTQLLAVA